MTDITPLSAHLRDVTAFADEHNYEPLLAWLNTENPNHWMQIVPREEDLLAVVGRMFERLERIGIQRHPFNPQLIAPFYHAYETAKQDPGAYLQTILTQQRNQILRFLQQHNTPIEELERLRRSIIRGGDRLFAESERLLDQIDDPDAFIKSTPTPHVKIRPESSREHNEQKIDAIVAKATLKRVESYVRMWHRVDTIHIDLAQREQDIDLLERRILIRRRLEERLIEIANIIDSQGSPTGPLTENPEPPATVDATLGIPEKPRKDPSRKRQPKNSKPEESAGKEPSDAQNLQTIGAMQLSLQKIQRALVLAIQGDNKIRIVITNEPHRQKFIQQWQELFAGLGFTGMVEFIDFPKNNGDLSPILIPRGMNTHDNRWSRTSLEARYFVIDVDRPRLILNHFKNPRGNGR